MKSQLKTRALDWWTDTRLLGSHWQRYIITGRSNLQAAKEAKEKSVFKK